MGQVARTCDSMEDDSLMLEEEVMEDVTIQKSVLGVVSHLSSVLGGLHSTRDTLHIRERCTFAEVTDPLKVCEFRFAFRMNRENFRLLLDLVFPSLLRNETIGALRNVAVELEVRMAIVLRITAGASDLDLMVIWGVSLATICYISHEQVAVLLEALPLAELPETEEKCRELAQQFSTSRRVVNPSLTGCVGVLDGISIFITNPTSNEYVHSVSCYHTEGFLRSACSSYMRFEVYINVLLDLLMIRSRFLYRVIQSES